MTTYHIALDIGNVCVKIAPERCLSMLGFATPADAAGLIAAEREFECGRIDENVFVDRAVNACAGRFTVAELRAAFAAILVEPVPGMTELVEKLAARDITPVFFSDISTAHLAQTRAMFPGAAAVKDGIYSFEAGAMKPDIRMFNAFERRFGQPLLYTDDRADLIAAARVHGWNARQFTDAGSLDRAITAALDAIGR